MPADKLPRAKFMTLVSLTGLSVLSLNMFLPSLPSIAKDFRVDYALANFSVAGYAITSAILHFVFGFLSDRFGRRLITITAISIFTLASIGCFFAPNIWIFLFFRTVQAVIAACYTMSLGFIRDELGAEKSASTIASMATIWAFAPMVWPFLGGAIDEFAGWRMSFVVFALGGAALFVVSFFTLTEVPRGAPTPIAQQLRAFRTLLASKLYWSYATCLMFSVGGFYVFLSGTPLLGGSQFGFSTSQIGIAMGSVTAGFIAGSFSNRFLSQRLENMTMILLGRTVTFTGLSLGLIAVLLGYVSPIGYFVACACIGIGNGLSIPASNVGLMSISKDLAGSAAGLSAAMTVFFGGAAVAALGLYINAQNVAHALLITLTLLATASLCAALIAARLERGTKRKAA